MARFAPDQLRVGVDEQPRLFDIELVARRLEREVDTAHDVVDLHRPLEPRHHGLSGGPCSPQRLIARCLDLPLERLRHVGHLACRTSPNRVHDALPQQVQHHPWLGIRLNMKRLNQQHRSMGHPCGQFEPQDRGTNDRRPRGIIDADPW